MGYFDDLRKKLSKSGEESDQDLLTSVRAADKAVKNPDYQSSQDEQDANLRYAQGLSGAMAGSIGPLRPGALMMGLEKTAPQAIAAAIPPAAQSGEKMAETMIKRFLGSGAGDEVEELAKKFGAPTVEEAAVNTARPAPGTTFADLRAKLSATNAPTAGGVEEKLAQARQRVSEAKNVGEEAARYGIEAPQAQNNMLKTQQQASRQVDYSDRLAQQMRNRRGH